MATPYQGYPYVNPVVIDVPTVDAATAAKWANLPRRPVITSVHKEVVRPQKNSTPSIHSDSTSESESNYVTQRETTSKLIGSIQKIEDAPVVYVDLPEELENNADASSSRQEDCGQKNGRSAQKVEDVPVVYVEIPDERENIGGATSTSHENCGQENPAFVEETIFYDPFENRQIDVNKPKESPESAEAPRMGSSYSGSSTASTPDGSTRPNRPTTLHLPSTSGASSSRTPSVPAFMNNESQVYGSTWSTEDGFTLSPLPVSDYPEPPPAYSEHAESNKPTTNVNTPPRTVVIVPETRQTPTLACSDRKFALCQTCGLRVHTVVVREYGIFTHLIALITLILCLLPITVVIYCTDFFKYRVHFCPNCNNRVGHEIPILGQNMVYEGPQ